MAMLVSLNIEMIGMKAKDPDATRGANKFFQASDKAGDYQKCKIDKADIRDVIKYANQARNAHRSFTMPFANKGYRILPAKRILEYTNEMAIHKANFESAVADVVVDWPNILTRAQSRLVGTLFNPGDYPSQANLPNYFNFDFDMIPIPEASHIVLDIEKEVIDELQAQLDQKQKEGLERAMADVWRRLYEPVKNMAKVLSEDRKIFSSMLANVEEIVELLPTINLAGDMQMTMLAAEIKQQLLGHTTGQIKDDDALKAKLAANAQSIVEKMHGYFQ
jgi:hypothetical protein